MRQTDTLTIYGYVCGGAYSRKYLTDSLLAIVNACKLTPVGEPLLWGYPLDGKGGVGETVLLPFAEGQVNLGRFKKYLLRLLLKHFRWAFLLFQPFTESFAVIDTYPDKKKDDGQPAPKVVIVIGSCIPLPVKRLTGMVRKRFGPVLNQGMMAL